MTYYARVKDGEILEYQEISYPIQNQFTLHPNKPRLLPVIEERPEYDQASEALDGPAVVVGATNVIHRWKKRAKTQSEIDAIIASVDAKIEREFERRWTAPIAHTVNGTEYMWHADRDAVTNIMGVMLSAQAVGRGLDTTRTWTPIGSHVGVPLTIADVIALGLAIAQRKDVLFALKKAKQAQLKTLPPADLAAYDVTAGW